MKRPYCILSAAISINGKIATARTRNSALSSTEDWKRVHRLRNSVDALMVGRGTVMVDDPKLLVKKELLLSEEELKHPIRVIADSQAQISPNAKVFASTSEVPAIIAVSEEASQKKTRILESKGAEVIICGSQKVDLKLLMEHLHEREVRKLMLEGGGKLNWSMFSLGLVDEIRVAIAPTVIGGSGAISLFEGEGYDQTNESPLLNLEAKEMFGDCLFLRYSVEHNKHRQ